MASIGSITIDFVAGLGRFATGIESINRSLGGIESSANRASRAVVGLVSAIAVGGVADKVFELADSFKNIEARLKIAAGAAGDLNKAFSESFDIAQRTSTSLAEVATLYTRVSVALTSLRGEATGAAKITEAITQSFAVSGSTASEAKGAIIQLNQALASGQLRGQEFNSVAEQAPRLLKAIADATGKTVGELRAYAAEGRLTSDIVIKSLEQQSKAIAKEYANLPLTVGRAFQQLENSVLVSVGNIDREFQASAGVAKFVQSLQSSLENISSFLIKFSTEITETAAAVGNFLLVLAAAKGAQLLSGVLTGIATNFNKLKASSLASAAASQTVVGANIRQAQSVVAGTVAIKAKAQADLDASLKAQGLARAQLLTSVAYANTLTPAARALAINNALATAQAKLAAQTIAEANARLLLKSAIDAEAAAKAKLAAANAAASTLGGTLIAGARAAGNALLGLVGGPIGATILALGTLAFAFYAAGKASEEAVERTKGAAQDLEAVTKSILGASGNIDANTAINIRNALKESDIALKQQLADSKRIEENIARGVKTLDLKIPFTDTTKSISIPQISPIAGGLAQFFGLLELTNEDLAELERKSLNAKDSVTILNKAMADFKGAQGVIDARKEIIGLEADLKSTDASVRELAQAKKAALESTIENIQFGPEAGKLREQIAALKIEAQSLDAEVRAKAVPALAEMEAKLVDLVGPAYAASTGLIKIGEAADSLETIVERANKAIDPLGVLTRKLDANAAAVKNALEAGKGGVTEQDYFNVLKDNAQQVEELTRSLERKNGITAGVKKSEAALREELEKQTKAVADLESLIEKLGEADLSASDKALKKYAKTLEDIAKLKESLQPGGFTDQETALVAQAEAAALKVRNEELEKAAEAQQKLNDAQAKAVASVKEYIAELQREGEQSAANKITNDAVREGLEAEQKIRSLLATTGSEYTKDQVEYLAEQARALGEANSLREAEAEAMSDLASIVKGLTKDQTQSEAALSKYAATLESIAEIRARLEVGGLNSDESALLIEAETKALQERNAELERAAQAQAAAVAEVEKFIGALRNEGEQTIYNTVVNDAKQAGMEAELKLRELLAAASEQYSKAEIESLAAEANALAKNNELRRVRVEALRDLQNINKQIETESEKVNREYQEALQKISDIREKLAASQNNDILELGIGIVITVANIPDTEGQIRKTITDALQSKPFRFLIEVAFDVAGAGEIGDLISDALGTDFIDAFRLGSAELEAYKQREEALRKIAETQLAAREEANRFIATLRNEAGATEASTIKHEALTAGLEAEKKIRDLLATAGAGQDEINAAAKEANQLAYNKALEESFKKQTELGYADIKAQIALDDYIKSLQNKSKILALSEDQQKIIAAGQAAYDEARSKATENQLLNNKKEIEAKSEIARAIGEANERQNQESAASLASADRYNKSLEELKALIADVSTHYQGPGAAALEKYADLLLKVEGIQKSLFAELKNSDSAVQFFNRLIQGAQQLAIAYGLARREKERLINEDFSRSNDAIQASAAVEEFSAGLEEEAKQLGANAKARAIRNAGLQKQEELQSRINAANKASIDATGAPAYTVEQSNALLASAKAYGEQIARNNQVADVATKTTKEQSNAIEELRNLTIDLNKTFAGPGAQALEQYEDRLAKIARAKAEFAKDGITTAEDNELTAAGAAVQHAFAVAMEEVYDAQFKATAQQIQLNIAKEDATKSIDVLITKLKGENEILQAQIAGNKELIRQAKEKAIYDNAVASLPPGAVISAEQESELKLTLNSSEFLKEQAKVAEEFQKNFETAINSVSDAFADFLTGGIDDFKDFGKSLERIAQQYLANLIRLFLKTKLQTGEVSIGSPTGINGSAGSGSGGGGFLSSLFNLGGNSGIFGGASSGSGFAGASGGAGVKPGLGTGGAGGGIGLGGGFNIAAGAVGVYSAYRSGNPLSGAASGAMAGATFGPIGAIVGGIIGALAGFLGGPKDPDLRLGAVGRTRKPEETFTTALGNLQIGVRSGVSADDFKKVVTDFDSQLAGVIASFGDGATQVEAVRARLATWALDLKGDAITAEAVLGSRFGAILSTFSTDIQEFVGSTGTVAERVQKLADAAFIEAAAGSGDLLGSFKDLAAVLTYAKETGESVTDTYTKLLGATKLLDDAIALTVVKLDLTRIEFIKFAGDIVDAAGGLQRASELWQAYHETFYSDQEQAAAALLTAQERRNKELADIGLAPDISKEAFRTLFESLLPTLTPEQIVEYLEAAEAIGLVSTAMENVAEVARQAQEELDKANEEARRQNELLQAYNDFFKGINQQIEDLDGSSEFVQSLRGIQRSFSANVTEANRLAAASGQAGAAQRDLVQIQVLATRQINQAINALRGRIRDLVSGLYSPLALAQRRLEELQFQQSQNEVSNINDVADASESRYEDELRALEDIKKFLDSLKLDKNLTILNPRERVNEAQSQFERLLALAQGGDVDALQQLTGAAQAYLSEARSFFASGDDYTRIFNYITGVLGALSPQLTAPIQGAGGGGGGSGENPEIAAQNKEIERLQREAEIAERRAQALELIGFLRELATATSTNILDLAESFGIPLDILATDLGINLEELTLASVEALALLARNLGIDLAQLTTALGVDLGNLADDQSLLNDGLEATLLTLPAANALALQAALDELERATIAGNPDEALAALNRLAANQPEDIRRLLAPYFPSLDIGTQLTDLDFLGEINADTYGIEQNTYEMVGILNAILLELGGGLPGGGGGSGLPNDPGDGGGLPGQTPDSIVTAALNRISLSSLDRNAGVENATYDQTDRITATLNDNTRTLTSKLDQLQTRLDNVEKAQLKTANVVQKDIEARNKSRA